MKTLHYAVAAMLANEAADLRRRIMESPTKEIVRRPDEVAIETEAGNIVHRVTSEAEGKELELRIVA